MTVDSLIDLIDNNVDKPELLHLLNALNDWPNEVDDISTYINEIKLFLGVNSINEIRAKADSLDVSKYSWQLESIEEFVLFLESNNTIIDIMKLDSPQAGESKTK